MSNSNETFQIEPSSRKIPRRLVIGSLIFGPPIALGVAWVADAVQQAQRAAQRSSDR